MKVNVKFEKENKQKPSQYNFDILFSISPLVKTQVFSRTSTIHPGIFRGRALSPDSVSPRSNTITSRDQFKPMRIGENLVVNYNYYYLTLGTPTQKKFTLLVGCD